MSDRVQLNEEQMEEVVGGIFDFYKTRSGENKCRVEGYGTYHASADAFDWFVQISAGDHYSAQEIVKMGLEKGYFW